MWKEDGGFSFIECICKCDLKQFGVFVGLNFCKVDNSCIFGWQQMYDCMKWQEVDGQQFMLYVIENCIDWWCMVFVLLYDEDWYEDFDSSMEDYVGDELWYVCMVCLISCVVKLKVLKGFVLFMFEWVLQQGQRVNFWGKCWVCRCVMFVMDYDCGNLLLNFDYCLCIVVEDLCYLDDLCVLFEYKGMDFDGVEFYVYMVGGVLNGICLFDGVMVGGEVMIVYVDSCEEVDVIVLFGFMDIISVFDEENVFYFDVQVVLVRLQSVSVKEWFDQVLKLDVEKFSVFIVDIEKVRLFVGDDVLLIVGIVVVGID